jgi:hypothetical protein
LSKNNCNPCDINTDSVFERNALPPNPVYVNAAGEFTIDSVDVLSAQFADNIIGNIDTNPLQILIRRYGNDTVNNTVNQLNQFVLGVDTSGYPALNDRMGLSRPITSLEAAEFMQTNFYTPTGLSNAYATNSSLVIRQLNDFYLGSWISSLMGGFCATVGNMFRAASALFDLIGQIGDAIGAALAAIQKIKNLKDPLKALFDKIKVKALIESIKKKIESAIKEAWRKVKEAVDNFKLEDLFEDIRTATKRVQQKVKAEVDRVKAILNDENRDTFLKKVDGLIDYVIDRFINPSLKSIELLVFRMCGFAFSIEDSLGKLKEKLENIFNNTKDSEEKAKNASAGSTAQAVNNGAVRFDEETRQEAINNMRERCIQASRDAAAAADENGDPPTVVSVTPPTNAEIDGIPTWEQLIAGPVNNLYINPGDNIATKMGRDAWSDRYVPVEAKVKLMRLAEEWGSPLRIISAYRSPIYNRRVRGKTNSFHLSGVAFDLKFDGVGSRRKQFEFANLAASHGWHGIGFYNSFIHVDIGGIVPGRQRDRPAGVIASWPNSIENQWLSWRRNN